MISATIISSDNTYQQVAVSQCQIKAVYRYNVPRYHTSPEPLPPILVSKQHFNN